MFFHLLFLILFLFSFIYCEEVQSSCGCGKTNRDSATQLLVQEETDLSTTSTLSNLVAEEVSDSSSSRRRLEDEKKKKGEERQKRFQEKMVLIESREGFVGSDKPVVFSDGESPKRRVMLDSYYIDKFAVTNQGKDFSLSLFFSIFFSYKESIYSVSLSFIISISNFLSISLLFSLFSPSFF